MTTDDDDDELLPDPDPDAEPTAAERAHARTFGELVGKTLLGSALPPAMSADERALLEVATVIRAASGGMTLAPSTQRAIVEDALRKAIGESSTRTPGARADVTPIAQARPRRRLVPWVIAGTSTAIAAAAIVLLMVRAPRQVTVTVPTASIPAAWTSRPADALIGPIEQAQAGQAGDRIDTIFADRLEGYRERTLGGGR